MSRIVVAARRSWAAFAFAACAALAALLLDAATRWPAVLGFAVHDAQVRLLRSLRPVPDESIALIGIDQASVDAIGMPLALWHRELGRTLEAVAGAGPRLVALDAVLPERSFDAIVPGLDRALLRGIVRARESGGIVLALQPDGSGRLRPIFAPFIAAAGSDATGAAVFRAEKDGMVRRVDAAVSTFIAVVARKLGRPARDGYIDYTRGAPFEYVGLNDVLRWADAGQADELRRRFAAKVVLIGSVLPLVDRRAQPIALAAWDPALEPPGLLIHAQALRSVLGGGFLSMPPFALTAALTLLLALAGAHGHVALRWAAAAAAVALFFGAGILALRHGVILAMGPPLIAAPLAAAARSGVDAWRHLRERNRIARTFAGYVSPQVFGAVLGGRLALRGQRRLAFLFADVRGFTSLTESAPAHDVVEWLNGYYAAITPILHAHGATIDAFRGDGLNAMFGAPQPLDDAAARALHAAQAMLAAVTVLNTQPHAPSMPISIGIGLSYGDAVFGDLGSPDRRDFTAIGDAVNLAARLQDMTKELGFPILATAEFHAALALDQQAALVDLDERPIKGHRPVRVWGWRST